MNVLLFLGGVLLGAVLGYFIFIAKHGQPPWLKLRKVLRVRGGDIFWFSFNNRTICGHSGRPEAGDVFTCEFKGGEFGVFEVVKVNWQLDPRNMYFADVKDVGYWTKSLKQEAKEAHI